MELFINTLVELVWKEHPRSAKIDIIKKIKFVFLKNDNRGIIEKYFIDNHCKISQDNEFYCILTSFFLDEIKLQYQRNDDENNLSSDISIEKVSNYPDSTVDIIENSDIQGSTVNELLKNPLVLEDYNPVDALRLIKEYYSLPYFEKEAYILRLKRKIWKQTNLKNEISNETPSLIDIESVFSEEGILSLQIRAAIRIKLLWKNNLRRTLTMPYNRLIEGGLMPPTDSL